MTDMRMDFQKLNVQNMQAVIDFARQHPDRAAPTIGYMQAAQVVLLVKGHSLSDGDRIESVQGDWKAKGKIAVEIEIETQKIEKTKKKVQPPPEEKLIFKIAPEVRSSLRELENAVEAAVAGTTMKNAKIVFSWAPKA